MKTSQRRRLAELRVKKLNDAASLSDAENTELGRLEALATAHPDASKDEDDTKPLSAEGFMARLTAAFSAKETLARENAALKERLTKAESDLAAANTAKGEAETKLATVTGQLTSAQAETASATAGRDAVLSCLGLKPEAVSGVTVEEAQTKVRAAVDGRVSKLAGEKLAELGFPAGGIPPEVGGGNSAGGGDALADLERQMAAEKNPKKLGELTARYLALRDKKPSGKN